MLRLKRAVVKRVTAALRPHTAIQQHTAAIRPRAAWAAGLHGCAAPRLSQIRRVDVPHSTAASTMLGLGAPIVSPYSRWARIRSQWSALFTSAARTEGGETAAEEETEGKPIPLPAHPDDPIQLPEHPTESNEPTAAATPTSSGDAPPPAPVTAATPPAATASAPSSSPSADSAAPHSTPPELKSAAPTPAEVAKLAAGEAAKARIHEEAENATFAPIPTAQPDAELKSLQKDAAADEEDPSASIPKLPSSDTLIRGTLWFDNMYPMRVHWLDLRYLVATHNHDVVIPKLFAKAFGLNGFRLLGATPRANEGGVFVHFEVVRTAQVQTPEQVTKEIITLLRAKPVHAALTPKAVRCHLVRGTPFLDDMASRFPYNRLKIEVRGPDTALADLTIEQLYNELNQFGKIFDLTLAPFEKGKSRQAVVQYVRMFSAVGARNCLHRLKLSVPLSVGSLPAMVPPKVDGESGSSFGSAGSSASSKPLPPPTADAYLFLNYDSILKTSYVTDFFVKHPRIMVPLLGLLFAAFTYLIFDPLRSWNITNFITRRLAWHELYARLPWPFGWIETQMTNFGNSSFFKQLKRGAGLGDSSSAPSTATSWSAREADEAQVRKWLNSKPDRLLFLTGPRGAGSLALIQKLSGDRKNVVRIDVSHIIDRADDEFVKAFAASVGFAPGFALLTWMSNIMDIFTPGASKASGSSTASSAQILKILECTSNALINIAHKENAKRLKQQRQKMASLSPEEAEAEAERIEQNPVPQIDLEAAKRATGGASAAAGAMDSPDAKKHAEEQSKAPQDAQKVSQSATATTIGSLLKMTGGLAPTLPAQTASQTAAAPAPGTPASSPPSSSSSSSAPTNNTFEPLSHAPVVAGSAKHLSPDTSPVRLSEPPLSYNESDTTEQQRNYEQFQAMQHANGGKKSMAEAKEGLAEPEPDSLPLFIIDGFNVENSSKHSNFLNVLASWAAEMSGAGVARFVFLSDAALEESVTKALPDVKVAEVVLSDASPEAAQQFLFSSLPPNMRRAIPDQQTIAALKILGGRYNDLMQLVRGVENGTHPIETVEEIVVQSMNTVKSMLFTEDKNVKWSKVQMWQVCSMIVASPSGTVLYDDLLFNIFQGDDTPLKALVRNDLLRVEPALSRGGDLVRAGSPVFLEAFKRLVHHQSKLKPGMDLLVCKYQIGVEQAKIDKIEDELLKIAQTTEEVLGESVGAQMMAGSDGWGRRSGRLEKGGGARSSGSVSSDTSRLLARQSFLVQLLHDSHTKIAGLDEKRRACEKEIKNIKKVE